MLIFNFHHVEPVIAHPDRKHISMTPEGLRTFIRTLRGLGFDIIGMRDVLASPNPAADSKRQVMITFDDGYENNLLYAVPVLEEERCPATIFVLPGRFGGTNAWDQGDLPEDKRDRLMTLEQMQSLRSSRMITLGSHGMDHRHLCDLDDAELQQAIHESYEILSREVPDSFVPVFAYPWGCASTRILKAMQDSPYQYAFGVNTAPWVEGAFSRFEVPRYSAYYRDGNPLVLMAKLARHGLLLNGLSGKRAKLVEPAYTAS